MFTDVNSQFFSTVKFIIRLSSLRQQVAGCAFKCQSTTVNIHDKYINMTICNFWPEDLIV